MADENNQHEQDDEILNAVDQLLAARQTKGYTVTLNITRYEQFQAICKRKKLSTSEVVDAFIELYNKRNT